ncbi:MAG TPA: DUF177 domain-containing protein [Candidatus Krumholzibacteria bacterium]|nr:DUF177 domain-containing protein [Candidatus Krumholzibacteria bacterium]HPD71486.1 DUF177 domain-containing protein [Candidatus Krumholzibacteria bacterium]HRY41581.1 DUF177 domain-containing protein [Candidatus Krumholzibacteria bacterium]
MKLDLDRTPVGQSDLPIDGRLNLDFGTEGPGEVRVSGALRVDNLEGRCVVRGELAAIGRASCDRCLGEFELAFPVPVELVVLRDCEAEDTDADTLVVHQRSGVVDLAEALREAAILAVPQSRICRDDCRGLCARCGADLNAGDCGCEAEPFDPRWEGLPD